MWQTNLGSRLLLIRVGLRLRVGRLSSLGLAVHSRLHFLLIGLGLGLRRLLLGGSLLGILLGGLLLLLRLAGRRIRILLGLRLRLRRGLGLGLLLALLGGLLLDGLLGVGGLDGNRLSGHSLLGNLGGLGHCEELGE